MTMRVRACVLAVALVVLGASSVFGQTLTNPTNGATLAAGSPFNSFLVGAPAGSAFAGGSNYNLAMNREGNRELGAPVSICAGTVGGVATANTAGTATTFNVGDVFTIEYQVKGTAPLNDPILATTGALGSANLFVSQNGAGQGVTATATAAMIQPAIVAGAVVIPPPQAFVTITITGAPAAATGINCIAVQGVRFDLGNSVVSATTGALGMPANNTIIAVVNQTSINAIPGTPAAPTAVPNALSNNTTSALAGNAFGGVNGGFPTTITNAVGTAFTTFGALGNGALGIANGTGLVTGGFSLTASATTKSGFTGVAPSVTVGGRAGAGAISVQQGAIPAATAAVAGVVTTTSNGVVLTAVATPITVNLPIADGGGLFRGFVASGPDTTTWLNAAGATTGTQVLITVNGMPAGSSVVFPAAVSSASTGVVLNMAGGGTISAPGGSVTYSTTVNEGISTTLGAVGSLIGPSVDIPFTVNPGTASSATGATVVITLAPTAGASAVPTYSGINGVTVIPSQVVGTAQTVLFTVANNQTTRTFPYVTFTGGTTAGDYDTGLVLNNTGRGVSVVNGTSCYSVAAGGTIPTGCPGAGVSALGNLAGQDGAFTVFFISSGATVASIRSTSTCSGGGAFPGSAANAATKYNGLSSGVLKQGDYWVALGSQVLACAGITGAWSGQMQIVADIPGTSGFAFISQFTNASGGATMGYIAN